MSSNSINRKYLPAILHIAAWGIILAMPLYILYTGKGGDITNMFRHYFRILIYGSVFYLNYFLFVPHLLFKEKKVRYFLVVLGVATALFFVMEYGGNFLFPDTARDIQMQQAMEKFLQQSGLPKRPEMPFHISNYIFTSLLVLGFSAGLRFMDRFAQNEKQRKEMEREMLNSELAVLKNQISPHFFFNTMNNIYSLIQLNSDDAQKAVLKLSGLMRYLLYESEQGNTMLSREIEFLTNYIDLMKLRLNPRVKLTVQFPAEYKDRACPPLLFISFVENAFKHGISYREPSSIDIFMDIRDTELYFRCKNSLAPDAGHESNKSGIGLSNVKKRLDLLFPNKHKLTIEKTDSFFIVNLLLYL